MIKTRRLLLGFIALALAGCFTAHAQPRLSNAFGDHMVLQRGDRTVVWGQSAPGTTIQASIAGVSSTATADTTGKFRVVLGGLKAGGPHTLVVSDATGKVEYQDVLIGDVYIASGQSNMQVQMQRMVDADKQVADSTHPRIRLLPVKFATSVLEPKTDIGNTWVLCGPESTPRFSAVAYYFARELQTVVKEDGQPVPIGMIQSVWGGTPAEAWTPRPALESHPMFAQRVKDADAAILNYPQARPQWQEQVKKWEEGGKKGERPVEPLNEKSANVPGTLFNAMIAPLTDMGLTGVIWYQGEANARRAEAYATLFPLMINQWREKFGRSEPGNELPFIWVQLANFQRPTPEPSEHAWAELRESQTKTLALPKTGQALAIDIGEAGDIHPRNKLDVGKRLAKVAMKMIYGADVAHSGPMYRQMAVDGAKVRLSFDFADGLTSRGAKPSGFAIAGGDRKWVWAEAVIDGGDVIVWSDAVKQPVAVRYGWSVNPFDGAYPANLYNAAGLPACPFRTDDWPGLTTGIR